MRRLSKQNFFLFAVAKVQCRISKKEAPRPNPYFTGRDDVLAELHRALRGDGRAVLGQAIQGLVGIGKTQTAIEVHLGMRVPSA
jgi:hypothetical protein